MKLIFLDVDGVLNHDHTPGWKLPDGSLTCWVLDTDCCFQLNRILHITGAKIVLSSTWRLSDEGRAHLNKVIASGSIIGKTVVKSLSLDTPRRVEILDWLQREWPLTFGWNDQKIEKIAVIDDEEDADLEDGSFFQTSFEHGGLTAEIADRIIQHLNS